MAIYQLPKKLHPDFAAPGKQPVGSVDIDWSNSISKSLLFFAMPAQKTHINVVNSEILDTAASSTQHGFNKFGRTVKFLDAFHNGESLRKPIVFAAGDRWTISWLASKTSASSTNGMICGDTGSANFIWMSSSGTVVRYRDSSGTDYNVTGSISHTKLAWRTFTYDGTTARYYEKGSLIGSSSGPNGSLNVEVIGDGFNLSDYGLIGDLTHVVIYKRSLSQSEIGRITSDPYQILKPKTPAFYFTADSGGGGITGTSSHQASTSTHSATGERSVTGASSHSAATATHSASGTISGQITGDANHQAETATQSATGERQITGVSAHQANQATHSSTGTVGSAISGSGNHQAQTATHSATGERLISGSSSHSASPSTQTAIGERTISGSATNTASTATHASSGSVGNVVAGSGNHAANDATHSATGLRIVGGTATHQADTSTHSATGSAQGTISGAAEHQATRATHAAVGLRLISGTASHQANTATQTASDIPIAEIPLGTRQISDLTPVRGILDTSPKYGILKLG